MDWVGRELCVAAGSGAVTSAVLIAPVIDGKWLDLTLPAVLGAIGGLLVGFAAVVGGKYALRLRGRGHRVVENNGDTDLPCALRQW
jgi:hypothetical protein